MAKTSMVMASGRRAKIVKKVLRQTCSVKELDRLRAVPDERAAAQRKLQSMPRDAKSIATEESLRDHGPFAQACIANRELSVVKIREVAFRGGDSGV